MGTFSFSRAYHFRHLRISSVGSATGSFSPSSRCMVAGQRQCPKLTFFRLGEHELLHGCSLLGFKGDESIWRPYPAAASSWSLFFEWMITDGRMASSGIDVPFQLIHYTTTAIHPVHFLLACSSAIASCLKPSFRGYVDCKHQSKASSFLSLVL
jgi:hypothetical protein